MQDETQAITLFPNYGFAFSHRGAARYYLSDFQSALKDELQALHIDPTDQYAAQYRDAAAKQLHAPGSAAGTGALLLRAESLQIGVAPPPPVAARDAPASEATGRKLNPVRRSKSVDGYLGPKDYAGNAKPDPHKQPEHTSNGRSPG